MDFKKEVYIRWLLDDQAKPLKAIHFLWEYLYTPEGSNPNITKEDELYILEKFVEEKKKQLNI